MRAWVLVLALVSMAMQSTHQALPDGPEESLPDSEKQVPPHHYCMNHSEARMPRNAHECHCDYVCIVSSDEAGHEVFDIQESPQCKTYCHKNGRRCTCWPEPVCPKPA